MRSGATLSNPASSQAWCKVAMATCPENDAVLSMVAGIDSGTESSRISAPKKQGACSDFAMSSSEDPECGGRWRPGRRITSKRWRPSSSAEINAAFPWPMEDVTPTPLIPMSERSSPRMADARQVADVFGLCHFNQRDVQGQRFQRHHDDVSAVDRIGAERLERIAWLEWVICQSWDRFTDMANDDLRICSLLTTPSPISFDRHENSIK